MLYACLKLIVHDYSRLYLTATRSVKNDAQHPPMATLSRAMFQFFISFIPRFFIFGVILLSASLVSQSVFASTKTMTKKNEASAAERNSLESNGLKRIAVMPFRVQGEMPYGARQSDVINTLRVNIVEGLFSSGQYRVLDGQYSFEKNNESMATNSLGSNPSETLTLGQQLGADQILVGTIAYLALETKTTNIYDSSNSNTRLTGDIEYQVIDISTREILFIDTHSFRIPQNRLIKLARNEADEKILNIILSEAATSISAKVLDQSFPVRVSRVENRNTIELDQGQNRLRKGQVVNVFSANKIYRNSSAVIKEPTPNLAVARLLVNKVERHYAIAKLVGGDVESIKKGDVIYRYSITDEKSKRVKHTMPGESDKVVNW